MTDDFDEEALARSRALAILDGDDRVAVSGSQEYDQVAEAYGAEVQHADSEVFGEDELDAADRVAQQFDGMGMEGKVSLRDQRWLELVRQAVFARINPPTILRGTLGGKQSVGLGKRIQVANWAGDDSETMPLTVTLSQVAPLANTQIGAILGVTFRPFGVVKFGTRGYSETVEVDIGLGTQFTVGASAMTIEVALEDTRAIGITTNPTATMDLLGEMSCYTVTKVKPCTRTVYVDNLAPGVSGLLPFPARAKDLTVCRSDTTTTMSLSFRDTNSNFLYGFTIPIGTGVMQVPVILSGGAAAVIIDNVTAFNVSSQLVYGLDL